MAVNFVAGSLAGLGLLGVEDGAEPGQGLVADDERGDDGSLAVGDQAGLLILLVLAGKDVEDVVAALDALVVRQQDEALGVVVQVVGGPLDDGEALVDAGQGLVAEGVGLGQEGDDVTVGLGEVGDDGGGEGLVGGVAQLDAAPAVLVPLDGVDGVADDGVVHQMLLESAL